MFATILIRQPGYKKTKFRVIGKLKNTDKFMNDSFWVGIWPGLNENHLNFIVEKIKEFITSSKK